MQNKIDAVLYGWGAFMFGLMHLAAPGGASYILTGVMAGVCMAAAVLSWIASKFE